MELAANIVAVIFALSGLFFGWTIVGVCLRFILHEMIKDNLPDMDGHEEDTLSLPDNVRPFKKEPEAK